jgi:hypothetical protein
MNEQNDRQQNDRQLLHCSVSRLLAGQVLPGDESLDIGALSRTRPGTNPWHLLHKPPAQNSVTLAASAGSQAPLWIIARIVLRSKQVSNPLNAAIHHSRLSGSGSPMAAATARFHEAASSSEMASPRKR